MLNRCIDLASQLQNRKQRIASIITDKKGRILSFGVNSYTKSHPRQAYYAEKCGQTHKVFLHSEISAIVNCKGQGYAIYTARVNRKNEAIASAPCPICRLALSDAKIKNIYYT